MGNGTSNARIMRPSQAAAAAKLAGTDEDNMVFIKVEVTEDERKTIKSDAAKRGASISAYILGRLGLR
jgi:hypothetical protein